MAVPNHTGFSSAVKEKRKSRPWKLRIPGFCLALTVLFASVYGTPALASSLTDAQRLDAYLMLASGFSEKGEYREALKYIDKCFPLCPEEKALESELWLKKGSLHTLLGEYGDGIDALTKSLALNDRSEQAYLVRGQAYAAQDEGALAAEDLEAYAGLISGDTEALPPLGELYISLDMPQEAVDIFTQYIEKTPSPALRIYFLRGLSLMGTGDFLSAIADFTLAADDPAIAQEALYNRGVCRLQGEDFQHALKDFNTSIELGAEIAGLRFNRAVSLMALADYESASGDFTKSMEEGTLAEQSLYNRGLCYLETGQYLQAETDFGLLLDDPAFRGNALYYRGVSRMALENFKSAIDDFSESYAEGASPSWSLHNRASCYFAIGDYDRAIEDHTVNIENGNLLALSYYSRSQCYSALTMTDLAQQDLLAALAAEEAENASAPIANAISEKATDTGLINPTDGDTEPTLTQ